VLSDNLDSYHFHELMKKGVSLELRKMTGRGLDAQGRQTGELRPVISARELRVLVPVLSGKPLAYESFYNWMAPKGTGYLNTQAPGQPALLDLLGVRYLFYEKSDPRMAGAADTLKGFRALYPVHRENQDFVVFRNPHAQAFLTAFASAARYEGDPAQSVVLALALAERHWPLIHADAAAAGPFARTYRAGDAAFLARREAKGVRIFEDAWMLEYGRGPVPTVLPFGLSGALASFELRTIARTIGVYGRLVVRELLRGKI